MVTDTNKAGKNSAVCLYCKTFVETKVRSNSKKEVNKSGGIASIIRAIIQSLSTDEYTYLSAIKEVQCKFKSCGRHYQILCEDPQHCCEILLGNGVFPLGHNPARSQEFKTIMARRNLKSEISCQDVKGITLDLNQDMINIVLKRGILVISENGGYKNGTKFILEDIQ